MSDEPRLLNKLPSYYTNFADIRPRPLYRLIPFQYIAAELL